MTVKPVLWTYEPRQDGSCDIKIYISHQNRKKYLTTGIKLLPKDWDDKRKEVKRSHPLASRINANLNRRILEITGHLLDGGTLSNLGKKQSSNSLVAYTKSLIVDMDREVLPIKSGTRRNYAAFLTRLEEYLAFQKQSDLSFEEVTMDFYTSFRNFLLEQCGCTLRGGFTKHIKILKAIMNRGLQAEPPLHQNNIHNHPNFRRYQSVESNKIYLTEEEIGQIENLDLSYDPHLALERDRFLVSYYFILRYSDSLRIQKDHFFRDEEEGQLYYRLFRSKKTDQSPVIPVKPLVWDLLQERNFDLSGGSNQESNRKLKTIASMAGIHEIVEQDGIKQPKWRFVTTHSARRSAATNLRLRGVDLKTIADLGGWKDIDRLRVYLRSSKLDSARVASRSSFFE